MKRGLLTIIYFVIVTGIACGQIVDDSTKLVYGAHSTSYTLESKIRENDSTFQNVDTTLYMLENFEVIKRSPIYYQDLGVNGSATNPIYYAIPDVIGRRTGFHAYDPYMVNPEKFKYYDTKSPYMNLGVAFGGNGRSEVDFDYSRNVKPNWNIGFDIYRMISNRQVGELALTNTNNQVINSTVDFYNYYESKNRKYTLLFHLLRFQHDAIETGGVDVELGSAEELFFQYADATVKLANATSLDTRSVAHAYQEYSLKPFFEIYHVLDRKSIKNEFVDFPLSTDISFFENTFIRTDSTLDASSYKEFTNEVGIKGKFSNTFFYGAYLKRRDINFRYVYNEPFGNVAENYIGGDVKLFVKNNVVGGKVEVLDGGQFYFKGFLQNKYVNASYTSAIYAPSFLSERYFGNHYEWSNNFDNIIVNSIEASAQYDFRFLSIQPKVSITNVDQYVYFGTDKRPAQTSSSALINRYSVRADAKIGKHVRLENDVNYTILTGGGADVFRIPDLLVNSRWYYQGVWFKKYMPIQIGVNIRYQSAFFANYYDPITQQFYLQNEFESKAYMAADVFVNFQAKRLRIFVKMTHINQPAENGYFATPFYPGQKQVLDMGVRWMFFD